MKPRLPILFAAGSRAAPVLHSVWSRNIGIRNI